MVASPAAANVPPMSWPRAVAFAVLSVFGAHRVQSQLTGAHALIAFGIKSGTQPPPSVLAAPTYVQWDVHEIRGPSGQRIPIGGFDVQSAALLVWVVTPKKLWHANYGFMVVVPTMSNSLELPRLGFSTSSSLGFGDVYVQPLNLGWHTPRADYQAGLAFYAPTGRFTPGANDNKGLGMWSFEQSAGATFYFDSAKVWSISALAFNESHTKKRGVDLRAGDMLTVEGGAGGTFSKGALTLGPVYGAQWKLTNDHVGLPLPADVPLGRNRIYTAGPEVTAALPLKLPWTASITARYLWDFDARSSFQGKRFIAFVTAGKLHLSPTASAPH